MSKITQYLSILFISLSAITLVALQMKLLGWILLLLGAGITVLFCNKAFRKNIILVYFSVAFLGLAYISTNIKPQYALPMGVFLFLALITPYFVSHYLYKDKSLQFSFHLSRNWHRKEISYLLLTAAVSYLLLPFLLRISESYKNWLVEPNAVYLIIFFLGFNFLGIWDELFFISTILGILRKQIPFYLANLTQSVVFTSFLYVLGFRGILCLAIFIFAFVQGYVYNKTQSLFYLISIHLVADYVLYLAVIHAYYPNLMPIFLIK